MSSLYLCNYVKIIRTIKISKHYPWTLINRLHFDPPDTFTFAFDTGTILVKIVEAKNFIHPIILHLYQLFGMFKLPFSLEIDPIAILPTESVPSFLIAHLFLSNCYALNLPVNDSIFNFLHDIQIHDQSQIDLLPLKTETKYLPAILDAFEYSNAIVSLKISGLGINNFFKFLVTVIGNNIAVLETLSIDCCDNFDNFSEFTEQLTKSQIHSFNLRSIEFIHQDFGLFVDILPQTQIYELRLINVNLSKEMLESLLEKSSNFSKLSHFGLSSVPFLASQDIFKTFFNFVFNTSLTSLELVDDDIDIADVFQILNRSSLPLITLNVSNNHCSSKFTGKYALPVTLAEIRLSNIEWSPTALVNLLKHQNYVNSILLDVSFQKGENLVDSYPVLKRDFNVAPINVHTLMWNNNSLSSSFFAFLTKLNHLERLEINNCTFPSDAAQNIINTIVLYIQNAKIKELSMRDVQYDLVKSIFAVIAAHQSLEALDVSDNKIGDSGLELLVDSVCRNTNIRQIKFDGCGLHNPLRFIECCHRLSDVPHLKIISKPEKDLNDLIEIAHQTRFDAELIESAWDDLKKKIDERGQSTEPQETVIKRANSARSFTKQKASWAIDIQLPYNKNALNQWDELRQLFSIEKLTGIEPDEPEALIDF